MGIHTLKGTNNVFREIKRSEERFLVSALDGWSYAEEGQKGGLEVYLWRCTLACLRRTELPFKVSCHPWGGWFPLPAVTPLSLKLYHPNFAHG